MGQVAGSDALGDFEGLVQRNHDLPGDGPSGEQTENQCQDGGQHQHVLGVCHIGVAHKRLRDREFVARLQQDLALGRHVFQGIGAGHLGITVLTDRGTVSLERVGGLLQVGDVFFRQFGR
ncbi:hypothetical protein D3C85_1374710 [compost metagenome]